MNVSLASVGSVAPPSHKARKGQVTADGRTVRDADGAFWPLGLTFMWGLYGAKYERQRILDHMKFLAPYGYDYLRILGEVGWPGETIDPRWPDYQDQLGWFMDTAYELAGLRTQVTLLGGGTGFDPMRLCDLVAEVVQGRTDLVMSLEAANEAFQNGPDRETRIQMVQRLRTWLPQHLVGGSTPAPGSDLTDSIAEFHESGANLFTIHTDRGEGDEKWREVRQDWDFKGLPGVVDDNEGPGVHSSVGTLEHPLQLAMKRATGIISGGSMFVLHIGDMVTGRDDPSRNRTANLWDVPNIDMILKTVRHVDTLMPAGCESWAKYNNGWQGHPLPSDAFWQDGADHGVNRHYAASDGQQFVSVMNGVKGYAIQTASRDMTVVALNPETGAVVDAVELSQGQTWRLEGRDDTMTGYILYGTYR